VEGTPLSVEGAYVFAPKIHGDERGAFLESFRADALQQVTGRPLHVAQTNTSVSAAGTVRGIHFADVPPGQAKYVTCTTGSVLDVVVDIRVGSPTFGEWDSVLLDDRTRKAVFVGEGLGHAFMALEDRATVTYLCSAPYAPGREHGVHPLDPAIGIEWPPDLAPLLSPKDSAAPSLAEAERQGLLPRYDEVRSFVDSLR
jgi:dTDP-4-dehydrorhamnose 3,5-epimerase